MMRNVGTVLVALLLCLSTAWARGPEKELQKQIFKAAHAGNLGLARQAVSQLAALDSEEAARVLLECAVKIDTLPDLQPSISIGVHAALGEGLKDIRNDEARTFLFEQLSSRKTDWRAKVLLVEVAESYDDPEADDAIVAALQEKKQHEKVLLELCRAAGRRQIMRAVNPLIDLVERYEKQRNDIWIEARLALTSATGLDLQTTEDWRRFWAEGTEDTFRPETGPGEVGSTVVGEDAPEFFGTEVLSKRLVIVLDMSGSMEAIDPSRGGPTTDGLPAGAGGSDRMRITRAKIEMVRLVESLSSDVQFTLIKYSTMVSVWNTELQRANAGNKKKAVAWTKAITHEGVTNTGDALEKAFNIEGDPNLFFLISDGSPTDESGMPLGSDKLDEIHDTVNTLNKFRKVRINTIGFPGANQGFMTRLAEDNDGEYYSLD